VCATHAPMTSGPGSRWDTRGVCHGDAVKLT